MQSIWDTNRHTKCMVCFQSMVLVVGNMAATTIRSYQTQYLVGSIASHSSHQVSLYCTFRIIPLSFFSSVLYDHCGLCLGWYGWINAGLLLDILLSQVDKIFPLPLQLLYQSYLNHCRFLIENYIWKGGAHHLCFFFDRRQMFPYHSLLCWLLVWLLDLLDCPSSSCIKATWIVADFLIENYIRKGGALIILGFSLIEAKKIFPYHSPSSLLAAGLAADLIEHEILTGASIIDFWLPFILVILACAADEKELPQPYD